MILVSGATGFVGSSLIARLLLGNVAVRAAVRSEGCRMLEGVSMVRVGDLGPGTDCTEIHDRKTRPEQHHAY